jgi:hypothetical protein
MKYFWPLLFAACAASEGPFVAHGHEYRGQVRSCGGGSCVIGRTGSLLFWKSAFEELPHISIRSRDGEAQVVRVAELPHTDDQLNLQPILRDEIRRSADYRSMSTVQVRVDVGNIPRGRYKFRIEDRSHCATEMIMTCFRKGACNLLWETAVRTLTISPSALNGLSLFRQYKIGPGFIPGAFRNIRSDVCRLVDETLPCLRYTIGDEVTPRSTDKKELHGDTFYFFSDLDGYAPMHLRNVKPVGDRIYLRAEGAEWRMQIMEGKWFFSASLGHLADTRRALLDSKPGLKVV